MACDASADKKDDAISREDELTLQPSHAEGVIVGSDLLRKLSNRQIQLIAIGGSIGTGLFVSIGNALHQTGPAGLLLAFISYCAFIALVNNGMAEMTTFFPVAGGFIRLAGHFVDDAFGFMVGYNFFLYQAFSIPFEISALSIVVQYWSADVPIWSICLVCLVLYAAINLLVVDAYGEAEFWLSGGKVILILSLFCFTFITMVGGNPKGDAYGFRHWVKPGPFAEYRSTGGLGRWEGFLAAIWNVSFCVVGPEFISMIAAEAKHPRIYVKAAYKTVYIRFGLFFLGSAFAVGIVLPYNDPTLVNILRGGGNGSGTAAASPYVIAMKNLGISVFPHIVNALLCTSIFSAGNTYVYCATRSLYSLALEKRAPRIFRKCTRNGIPIYCFLVVMCFACLSFLQVSKGTANFLNTIVNFVTAAIFINNAVMAITFVFFYRAMKAQGFDRKLLPYYGYFQPYCGYVCSVFFVCVMGAYGYTSFKPWDTKSFFNCYTMVILDIALFFFWKTLHRTSLKQSLEVDLLWERPLVDAYEAASTDTPTTFWAEMGQFIGIGRRHKGDLEGQSSLE